MGRWAQRQRTGGAGSSVNYITRVELDGVHDLVATYRFAIDGSESLNADYNTLPDEFEAISVSNEEDNVLRIMFSDDVDDQVSLRYTGDRANVLTPQTIDIV